ncbi:septal ring lytic transglycosylase RlpA family protein [Burkholderiaceae bacterium FT117]|uniref:septal ring lytic transglycosylase RlpA family protein n=1 Tax=Zeimonas sediminis TaxID=2944268 RepID=UPI0023430979|nr:septal ring lytic transglycosylase RlpA family protein [Zeimonas sediminis]MCM5568981.1 septal ring lytic transglycosylase RlpA family protein [Zeimonas sediminis]
MPIDERIMVNRTPTMLRLAAVLAAAGSLLAAPVPAVHAQQRPGEPGALPFLTAPLQSLTAPPATEASPQGNRDQAPARDAADRGTERITQTGRIAYYGKRFAGRRTASGERFDPEAMTMAHRTLPFGTRVRVTNLANGNSVILRVNDRGPSGSGRIADVSEAAAERLDMIRDGVVEARLEVLRVRTVR